MELEDRTPATLFEAGVHRPLVAAFFGGTGVGKSSLLNRLAGQPIAQTGVVRPTSREVSVYMHESVQFSQLPRDFPVEQVRVARHRDEHRRQVLWIDMPDFDSVEQHNRELALGWLPHIDVLIYVVNPERYRDDSGWRLLQAHGGGHAWVFVMNHWDRGHPAQMEDFTKLLAKGGFRKPVVLRTDCRESGTAKEDDFERLQAFLQDMADRHVLHQLEIRAEAQRLESLREGLSGCLLKLGNEQGYRALEGEWNTRWQNTRAELMEGLEWPVQTVARAFVGHEANPLRRAIDLEREHTPEKRSGASETHSLLWDGWAEDRLRDSLDALVVEAGNRGLPAIPLKAVLDPLQHEAESIVLRHGQRFLRQALAKPGNAFQRTALRLTAVLSILLPLAAIGWVSYRVVEVYYKSGAEHLAYLGTDFAIHSGLLIALAWLLPFFAYRKLKPSTERTAEKGLRSGLASALSRIGEKGVELLAHTEQKRQTLLEEGRLLETLAIPGTEAPGREVSGLLDRVLPVRRQDPEDSTQSIKSK